MPFFTSPRERRLWLWTLVIIVVIYATIGIARPVLEILQDQNLVSIIFIWGMIWSAATVFVMGLKTRPGLTEIGIAVGMTAIYLMVFLRMTLPEERTHLIEYSVVATFIYEALLERANHGRYVPLPAVLAIVLTTFVGVIDEGIQFFLPGRVFDTEDIVFNFLAATMAVTSRALLTWIRKRYM